MGSKARLEAEQATKLEPNSSVGFKALGWICQFNDIGVQYARGFDWDCAVAAFKRALELEPDDSYTQINLAIIEEFDHDGERYTADAHLADAIRDYRAVKQKDKSVGDQYNDNILFDLLYSGKYQELLDEIDKCLRQPRAEALAVSQPSRLRAATRRGGRLGALTISAWEPRNETLRSPPPGIKLLHLRLYTEAAGILSAAIEGQNNSAAMAQQIAHQDGRQAAPVLASARGRAALPGVSDHRAHERRHAV